MSGTVERCGVCGHALSMHNDLGYCRARSRSKGECPCDLTTAAERLR